MPDPGRLDEWMQKMPSGSQGLSLQRYFHSKLDSKCKVKGLLVQDLFEDGATTNPRTKLSCLTWWWSQKLIHRPFPTRTVLLQG